MKKKSGMSTTGAVVGASMVVLGASAAGLLMFGNVAATTNNVGIDQAFNLLSNLSLSSGALHGITTGLSHLAQHLGGIGEQVGHVGGQVVGQIGHAAAPVMQGVGRVGGQVVGQVGNVAAPVVNQIGQVGGQVVGQVGDVAAPVATEGAQLCGEVCCVSFHAIAGTCQDVCKFETLQTIGNFICHVIRIFS
jgi:hypothetical protein